MEYRKLGTSNLDVSVVGIGCWAIGAGHNGWGPVDDNESVAAVREGLDLGMTLIDTAPSYGYGHSEVLVGKAVAGRRDEVILATKCGLTWRETGGRFECSLKPDSVRKECDASLRRLRVESIDVYQIHRPDPDTPLADTMEALLALYEQGKIRTIGVSNFNCQQMSEARRAGRVDALQPELSLLEPQAVDDLLPYCREYGIGVITHGSLARGLLTGKFNTSSRFTDLRADDPRFKGEAFLQNLAFIERLRPIAERVGCTMSQLALRWVIQQDGVSSAIAGVKRPSQTRENAAAPDSRIPTDQMEEIERLLTQRG
jgi:aryl-alcohol dehydrogenase-like predicted oxidoreductase